MSLRRLSSSSAGVDTRLAMALLSIPDHELMMFPCQHREPCAAPGVIPPDRRRMDHMDKDRIKGSTQQVKGSVKEKAGKATGDAKLETEGKADQTAGKVRNTVGGLKKTPRGDD